MGNTKSYRFSEETNTYLAKLEQLLGANERQIIEGAIEKLFNQWDDLSNNIVLDFHDNLHGINTYMVEEFIDNLPRAGYEIDYYGNNDRLVIRKIE